MYWTPTPTDGEYDILPPKIRGAGANTYNSAEVTDSLGGMVVIDGLGTVTLGYYSSTAANAVFIPFSEGAVATDDVFVNHGFGARLAAQVTGADSALRIGYAGKSK